MDMPTDWRELFEMARTGDDVTGWYNRAVVVDVPGGEGRRVVVRVPVEGVVAAHPRLWREADITGVVRGSVAEVPAVLHASADPVFEVLEFVPGVRLDVISPAGMPVPWFVLDDVAELFARLAEIPVTMVPPLPDGWPTGSDSIGFARMLVEHVTGVFYQCQISGIGTLFRRLGLPAEPFRMVAGRLSGITRRRLVVIHTDVHRGNIIVAGRRCWWLDWELSLLGDPVYEIAAHAVKMSYSGTETDMMLRRWLSVMPDDCTAGFEADFHAYVEYELVKSAMIFAARLARMVRAGDVEPERLSELAAVAARRLALACPHWDGNGVDVDDAAEVFTWWATVG